GRPQVGPGSSAVGQLASNTESAAGTQSVPAVPGVLRLQSPDNNVTPIAAASPVSQPTHATAVTLASGSGSVYAVAAEKAERERQNPIHMGDTSSDSAASVYDASRGTATLRR